MDKLKGITLYLVALSFLMTLTSTANAQNLEVQALDAICQIPGQALALSDIVYIEGPETNVLEGVQVSITNNYDRANDSFTYTFADNIQGQFDSQNGIFTLSGQATIAKYRLALERLFFNNSPNIDESKTINITLSGVDFLVETGHFYQFFSAQGISWSDAKEEAESKELFGLQGYLTTITSAAENQFILDRVSGTAWLGASDAETEGVWKWVTGPENGTIFWEGLMNGTPFGYHNWQPPSATSGGEPNQSGNEDYAHMMSWTTPSGQWNDLPDEGGGGNYEPTGFIVEYGGLPGDPDILAQISGNSIIDWQKEIDLTGATSVCPNIQGVPYNATALDAHSYSWTVEGGTIVSGQATDEIIVNWGNTNDAAKVSVEVSSDLACLYNEELLVKINEKLEPPLPVGNDMVCFTDINTPVVYSTPFTPGSSYTWKPTNGTVVSGQGTNEVQILWHGPGVGSLFFTESTSTATDICDGDSPILTIDLRSEIIPNFTIANVKCYGGNDGSVEIEITSGSTLITYDWIVPTSATTTDNKVENLSVGLYAVIVTVDDCSVEFPFEITEPEELSGSTDIANVRCFGESNGQANAFITGGTGSYRYDWSHDPTQSNASVSNLPAGNHSVRILDDNDCELVLNFVITEPDLLVIDEIIATLVSCPGGSDGTLEAFVSGGTAPYTFEWQDNSSSGSTAEGYSKGNYSLKVIDANGCEAMASQEIEEAIPRVVLPNAFSPNGDGTNDFFGPTTPCEITFKMEVYNRWGQVIFSTESANVKWDGTFKGGSLASGKYTFAASWIIEANGLVIEDSQRGEIQLIK